MPLRGSSSSKQHHASKDATRHNWTGKVGRTTEPSFAAYGRYSDSFGFQFKGRSESKISIRTLGLFRSFQSKKPTVGRSNLPSSLPSSSSTSQLLILHIPPAQPTHEASPSVGFPSGRSDTCPIASELEARLGDRQAQVNVWRHPIAPRGRLVYVHSFYVLGGRTGGVPVPVVRWLWILEVWGSFRSF